MFVCVDFETYYDDLYGLGENKLTGLEYITDRRFKAHMMGVVYDHANTELVPSDKIQYVVDEWRKQQAMGEKITLLAHNTPFDGLILSHHYGFIADYYCDTKAMSAGLWHHQSSSLKELAIRLWPDDPSMRKGDELIQAKGMRDLPPDVYQSVGGYCIQDARLCDAAFARLRAIFPADELDIIDIVTRMTVDPQFELDFDLIERYIPFLERQRKEVIAKSGLHVFAETYNPDKKGRPQFALEWEKELKKGRVQPEDRNFFLALKTLNSTPAFSAWLTHQRIAIPMKPNDKGKMIPAFGQQDFVYQQMTARHPQHRAVWEARKVAKSNTALTRAVRYHNTALAFGGKIPLPLKYGVAHTHRFGGAEKLNAQNLQRNAAKDHPHGDLRPGALRRAILAPPDQYVYVADSSNIEARQLAYVSDNIPLLEVFANKGDPYIWMAEDIYNRPLNKKDNPTERGVGKATLLGSGYGMGKDRFKDYLNTGPLGMPPIFFKDEAMYGFIISTFRRKNHQVPDLWARGDHWLIEMAEPDCNIDYKMLRIRHQRIILPSGLALEYPNLRYDQKRGSWVYDSKEEGVATSIWGGTLVENIMQALTAVFIKEKMRAIHAYFKPLGGRVALQVHDEVIALGPRENAEQHMAEMLRLMCIAPDWAPGLPVDAEGDYAHNYCK